MKEHRSAATPSAASTSRAFLLSITVASMYIFGAFVVNVLSQRAKVGLFFPILNTALVVASDLPLFAIFWLSTAIICTPPFSALVILARRYKLNRLTYFLITGLLLGLAFAVIAGHLSHGMSWYTDVPNQPTESVWQEIQSIAKIFCAAGTLAGLAFWMKAGRYFR